MGIALLGLRRPAEAAAQFQQALEIEPDHIGARQNLGVAMFEQGKHAEAIACWREVLRVDPNQLVILNLSARILATSPDARVRDSTQAVVLAEHAVQLCRVPNAEILDTLAMAYAAAGRFSDATMAAQAAQRRAMDQGNMALAEAIGQRIESFRNGHLIREQRGDPVESSQE